LRAQNTAVKKTGGSFRANLQIFKWLERNERSNHWEFDSVPTGLIGFSRDINLRARGGKLELARLPRLF